MKGQPPDDSRSDEERYNGVFFLSQLISECPFFLVELTQSRKSSNKQSLEAYATWTWQLILPV